MSDHQKETQFLLHCLRYHESAEHEALDQRILQIQRDELSVRRAVRLMAVLTALAAVCLGYAAALLPDYPHNLSRFATRFIVKVSCALGLASLVSLLGFVGVWARCRKDLGERREECRRLGRNLLESRLGQPRTMPLPGGKVQDPFDPGPPGIVTGRNEERGSTFRSNQTY